MTGQQASAGRGEGLRILARMIARAYLSKRAEVGECLQEGVDVVFCPANEEMYSPEHKTYVVTEELSGLLCGSSRPTHFRGVTTVVTKLFHIVQPDVAVFGQKDYQQAVIIKKMVQDLNFDVEIVLCPVVREEDGLALSSRNKYLDKKQRAQANVLYRSLLLAERV